MQRESSRVEVVVPWAALSGCRRSQFNLVPPVAVALDGLNLQVSVDVIRGEEERRYYLTMDLRGVPKTRQVEIKGSVTKFIQAQARQPRRLRRSSETSVSSRDTDTGESSSDRGDDEDLDGWGRVRVFDVEGEGNGRLVKMALGDARRVLASLTVTHVRPLGESLNAVRGARSLCDVVLHAAGRDFPAHKVVLSAISPVFLRMFTGAFVEATAADRTRTVVIEDVPSAAAFEKLLEFLYTATVVDFADEEVELLGLADRFMVDNLKRICVERLAKVGKERTIATLRASVERPFVPEEVCRSAAATLLLSWDELSATDAWRDFQRDHPVGAKLLSAVVP